MFVGGLEDNREIVKVTHYQRDMTDIEPEEREVGQNVKMTPLSDIGICLPCSCREGKEKLHLGFL